MNSLLQDFRYATRQLYKKPGFSATAILTIALAIGVTTAVFSVLYAILIRPLPYQDPSRIYFLQTYSPQGYTQPASYQLAEDRFVSPDYFNTMGIQLVRGRLFDPSLDTRTSQPVMVVNEAFVKKFFAPGEDPIGRHITSDNKPLIVGVVKNIRQDIYQPPMAEIDYPVWQMKREDMWQLGTTMQLIVHSSVDPETIIPSLREVFHQVDPGLPFRQPQTMREVIAEVLIFERLENWLFGTFAGLAILLAIVGLYGLISHEVDLSIRDIGVRMALGATRLQVLTSVYRRVGILLAIGVAVGLMTTFAVQRLLAALIVIHIGRDAAVIAALAAGLVFFGLLAALLPARRAASTEPMLALRYE